MIHGAIAAMRCPVDPVEKSGSVTLTNDTPYQPSMRRARRRCTLEAESGMGQLGLHPSSRPFEAEWLVARRAPFDSYCVASVVAGGFPAYVRILHPALGVDGERLGWADVARQSGRMMHRRVQFHAINRSSASGSEIAAGPPESGNLPPDLLRAACAALAEHTRTPDHCWFGLWNGYGWPQDTGTAAPSDWLNAACVHFPQRDYLLFEGGLDAATELGWKMSGGHFVAQSPNLLWPDDHAWCLASEIDLFCTLVGGSNALAENLLADPRLEVWRVFADDSVTARSDDQNR